MKMIYEVGIPMLYDIICIDVTRLTHCHHLYYHDFRSYNPTRLCKTPVRSS